MLCLASLFINNSLFYTLIVVIVGAVAIAVVVAVDIIAKKKYKESEYYNQTHKSLYEVILNKGATGEYLIGKKLQKIPGYKKLIYNCYVPKTGGTTTEIDVIMIHEKGIYVFESKNYKGWIFGTETQTYWVQCLQGRRGKARKLKFYNPIMQNKTHVKWLRKYLATLNLDTPLYSYIVFGNSCELKNIVLTSHAHEVVTERDLLNLVRKQVMFSAGVLNNEQIDAVYERLYSLTQVTEVEKLRHIYNVESIKSDVYRGSINHETVVDVDITDEQPLQNNNAANDVMNAVEDIGKSGIFCNTSTLNESKKVCKRCGAEMILRMTRKGENSGKQFWGCSKYPQCKYTEKTN